MTETRAEIRIPTRDLRKDIPFFTKLLGMRMDSIYPADDPAVAVFSGHGLRVRADADAGGEPATLRILCVAPDDFAKGQRSLTSPGGTKVEIDDLNPPVIMPDT